MLNKSQLARCKEVDVSSCDINSLMDLREINIDTTKPVTQRIESFIEQVQDPNLFKVGDIVMIVDYGNG